jgi:hypothetical protein
LLIGSLKERIIGTIFVHRLAVMSFVADCNRFIRQKGDLDSEDNGFIKR